jgi:hemoglobin
MMATETTLYDAVGGMAFFEALVGRFYAGVAHDSVLRPLYPGEDLGAATRLLTLFLAQYWGGPTAYGQERGHPALRMRHARFAIGPDERDRWLHHMRDAIEALEPPPEVARALTEYFDMAAESLRNREVGRDERGEGASAST